MESIFIDSQYMKGNKLMSSTYRPEPIIFVTIKTTYRDSRGTEKETDRNVTLCYVPSKPSNGVQLLGNLEHATKIVVDQELVDKLQALVNLQAESKGA